MVKYYNKDLSISSRLLQFISTNPEGTTSKVGKTTSTSGATSKTLLNMAGTWKLQTVYAGNKYEYDSSIVTKSINVVKKDTNLTISYTPSTVYVDDTVTYTVILKCVDTVLQGIQVVLQLDDDNNVTKTTDSNGKVTITKKYTVSQKSTLKANSLETYKYKPSTASQTITVKKLSTTLSAIDQSGIVTDTITVPITIFDQNNKKPNCGTINIKEGSTIIKTLNVATDTLSFDRVFTQAGTKTYTLEYKDTNNRYESSTSTVKVTARTLNTTLSAVDQSGRVGDTLTVPITILDERNKKPTIGTITIKDGNTTIKTLNVATDTLSFDRVFSEAGTKTYTIEYKDTSNKYSASSTTVNVTARALNTTINILSYTINSNTSSTIPTNYAFTAETSSYFQIDYNITDEDNNIISTGQTSITAPSGVEIIETDKYVGTNKKNSFNIPELTCGNKTLTINYAGTNVYKSSTRDLTVNPTSVDTVITLPTSAVYMKDMGDTSSDDFTVSIETKYGKPVRSSNGKLILYIQRKTSTSEITSKYKVWESTIGSNSTNTWTLNAYDDLNWTSIIADMKKQNKLIYTEYTLSAEYVNSGNNCYNNSSIEAKIGNMIAQCTSPRINIQLSAIAPIYRDDGITTGTTQSMTITDTTPRDDYVFNMYRYSKFKLEAVVRDKQNNIVGGINTDFGFINYDKDVIDYDDEDNEIGRTPAGEEITSSDIIITPTNAVTTYTGGVTVDYTRPNNDVMIAQDNLYAVFRFGVYSELFPTQKEYKIKLIDILKEVNITLPTGSVNVYDSGKSDSENFSISVKDSNGNSVLSGTLKVYLQSVKYSDLDPIEVWSTNVTSSTNSWTGNAYSLFSYTSLFNTMKNLNYLIFSGYQIVAKYIPTNPQYATMNKTANASLQYKCKSPSIELIGISSFKEDKSHRFDINEEHNWLINTSGTGVIQGGTTPLCDSFKVEPISSGALNRTLYLGDYNEVQFRVLDTNGNRIGGIQFFQWFTAESTTYRIYKTDENGEYVYDSNGEKILATDEYYEYPDGVPLTDAPLDPCYPKYPVPIAKFNRNPDLNKTTYTEDTMFDWTFGNSTGNTDDLKFTIVFDQYLSNIFPDISNKRDNPYRYVFSRVATSPVVYTATFSIILDLIIHSSH